MFLLLLFRVLLYIALRSLFLFYRELFYLEVYKFQVFVACKACVVAWSKRCREQYANVHGDSVLFVVIAYFVDMWCCYYVFVHQLLDNYHDLITTRVVTGLYRCHELEVYAVAKRSQLIHMLVSVCIHRNHRVYICMFLFMMLTQGMLTSTEPFCFVQLF